MFRTRSRIYRTQFWYPLTLSVYKRALVDKLSFNTYDLSFKDSGYREAIVCFYSDWAVIRTYDYPVISVFTVIVFYTCSLILVHDLVMLQ